MAADTWVTGLTITPKSGLVKCSTSMIVPAWVRVFLLSKSTQHNEVPSCFWRIEFFQIFPTKYLHSIWTVDNVDGGSCMIASFLGASYKNQKPTYLKEVAPKWRWLGFGVNFPKAKNGKHQTAWKMVWAPWLWPWNIFMHVSPFCLGKSPLQELRKIGGITEKVIAKRDVCCPKVSLHVLACWVYPESNFNFFMPQIW